MNVLAVFDLRLLFDVLCASLFGFLLFTRVNEQRTLWLLRGYLFLVALAWFVNRFKILPLTSTLIDALVLACSLSLAILWQGELRRLMELLGTGRLAVLLGNPQSKMRSTASTVAQLTDAAGRLSKSRRGATPRRQAAPAVPSPSCRRTSRRHVCFQGPHGRLRSAHNAKLGSRS